MSQCHPVCPHTGGGPEGSGSPGSSPDPNAATEPDVVRAALRDFLRELQDTQRERVCPPPPLPIVPQKPLFHPVSLPQEELRVQVGSLGRRLAEVEEERDNASARAQQLQKLVAEIEEGDGGWCFGVHPPHILGFRGDLSCAGASLVLEQGLLGKLRHRGW